MDQRSLKTCSRHLFDAARLVSLQQTGKEDSFTHDNNMCILLLAQDLTGCILMSSDGIFRTKVEIAIVGVFGWSDAK